jgi:DNA polymerase III subunit beta
MNDTNTLDAIATISRNDLASALTFASLGLPKRPVLPVLTGMLVTVNAAGVELATFDYETAARAVVPCETAGEATTLVSGTDLTAAVRTLPKGKAVTADLAVGDHGMVLLCEGIETTLAPLPRDEYPVLPSLPELAGVADAVAFADAVRRVVPFAGRDDRYPVLTNVKLRSDDGNLELHGTDTYRLAMHRIPWTGPDGADALIPATAIAQFAGKADKHGKAEIYLDSERAAFSDGTRTLTTRLGSGEYPKRYESAVIDDMATWVTVDGPALLAAVKRAGTMTERNSGVHVDVTTSDRGPAVTVTAYRDGSPVSSQAVPCAYEGPDAHFMFNPAFLADSLSSAGTGTVRLGFTPSETNGKPVQVRGSDGFAAVTMPIRRQS